MAEERGQYEIEPIESIEQIEQEIQEINEPDNTLDVGEQFGGFVSYHKGLSDQADAHMYDDSTLVIYDGSRKRVTLDAIEAWNLFAFLESQKDRLWSNMRGKPADISFLEMECQQGIYRIAGQDEMGRDVKWNLFAFLESQKDRLWSNMRGKPADISFLEMEDQQGIYRIAGQDESMPVR